MIFGSAKKTGFLVDFAWLKASRTRAKDKEVPVDVYEHTLSRSDSAMPVAGFHTAIVSDARRLALRHSAENIIRDYAAYVTANPKDRAGSFRSFVCNTEYNKNPHQPNKTLVGKCYLRALDQIGSELKKRDAAAVAPGTIDADAPAE